MTQLYHWVIAIAMPHPPLILKLEAHFLAKDKLLFNESIAYYTNVFFYMNVNEFALRAKKTQKQAFYFVCLT